MDFIIPVACYNKQNIMVKKKTTTWYSQKLLHDFNAAYCKFHLIWSHYIFRKHKILQSINNKLVLGIHLHVFCSILIGSFLLYGVKSASLIKKDIHQLEQSKLQLRLLYFSEIRGANGCINAKFAAIKTMELSFLLSKL